MNKLSKKKGFTLIEILVVIGIIALLATIVLIAINPARQFAQARNSQRVSNVNTLLNAIGQNLADNKGIFTCPGVTIAVAPAASSTIGTGGANLASCLVPTYIGAGIPMDPKFGTPADTGYEVLETTGRYMVCVKNANQELATAICVNR
ncbi:MAG: type II secretion system protein [Patescibacteria group bacterium]